MPSLQRSYTYSPSGRILAKTKLGAPLFFSELSEDETTNIENVKMFFANDPEVIFGDSSSSLTELEKHKQL